MDYERYLTGEMSAWIKPFGSSVSDITIIAGKNLFVLADGVIFQSEIFVTRGTIDKIVEKMCRGSVYANQSTLRHGYITLDGGDRVGAVGSVVADENGKVTHMREITALNIRISREIKGAADKAMPHILQGGRIFNTLIISPPSRGKTTILRDAARQCGDKMRCGIVDERCEIAGQRGERDVGKYTSVINSCSKGEGMMMLLRSMAPSAVFTDEIGSEEDEDAMLKMLNAGIKTVCTAHGYDERDIMRRNGLKRLYDEGVFEKIIVLSASGKIGSIEKVIDREGKRCCQC